jgi:TPR repeat protein
MAMLKRFALKPLAMGLMLALLAWPAAAGDYKAAYQELRPLEGDAKAQYILGHGYFEGKGVPKDNVRAYMWFSFSEARGFRGAARGRKMVARKMTPARIAEAQRQARGMAGEVRPGREDRCPASSKVTRAQ